MSDAPRLPKLVSGFGFEGPWNGARRPLDPAAPKSPRRRLPALSPEEFEASSPEEKIALANGGCRDQ